MNKTHQQTDDLTRRIEDAERELAALKALATQAQGITRARAFVFIDDTVSEMTAHRRGLEDATTK